MYDNKVTLLKFYLTFYLKNVSQKKATSKILLNICLNKTGMPIPLSGKYSPKIRRGNPFYAIPEKCRSLILKNNKQMKHKIRCLYHSQGGHFFFDLFAIK